MVNGQPLSATWRISPTSALPLSQSPLDPTMQFSRKQRDFMRACNFHANWDLHPIDIKVGGCWRSIVSVPGQRDGLHWYVFKRDADVLVAVLFKAAKGQMA